MKNFTIFAALLVASMATAQVQSVMTDVNVKDMQLKSIDVEMTIDREKFTAESYANRFAKKANAANANYNGIDYYSVDGMMHGGITIEGGMFVPLILLPYQDVTVWENRVMPLPTESWKITEAATTWNVDGQVTENSQTCEAMYDPLLFSAALAGTPVTNDHTVLLNDASVEIKGYQYGSGEAAQYVVTAVTAGEITDGNMPMTLCGMYCDPLLNDGDTRDWYIVGAGAYGDYSIGTGLNIEGKSMDTIGSIVRNVSPMKVEQIDIMVCDKTNQGGAYMFPEGASVKVEIFSVDLTNDLTADMIKASEPLYTTTMTIEDYTEFNAQLGMISAKFYEEDIFGGLMQVPVLLEGDFYVQFTNFNESGCKFGFMSDYSTPAGTTLYTWDGELTTLWSNGGANMLINYDAYWPTIMYGGGSDVLVAPVEGGYAMDVTENGEYAAVALYSTVLDFENWGEVEAPEWIEYLLDESTLATNGYVVAQFAAAPLPAGETGRTGIVTIDADGYKLDIVIKQGDGGPATGVENVVAPVFNGKTFNLLGVEVDENYKGIVIKNGQKFIQ